VSVADWKPYDVPVLTQLLAEQPTDTGSHTMAWQQTYETLTDQRQRLLAARAVLTETWPQEYGSAAGSFYAQVDALTDAMAATAETAVKAHGALTGIVTAVDGATAKVSTLHQSWQQNEASIGGVVPTEDWTQPLNNQAHNAMGEADVAIAEHATQLSPPVPYTPPSSFVPLTPIPTPRSESAGTARPSMKRQATNLQPPPGPVLTKSPGHPERSPADIADASAIGGTQTNLVRNSSPVIGARGPNTFSGTRGDSTAPAELSAPGQTGVRGPRPGRSKTVRGGSMRGANGAGRPARSSTSTAPGDSFGTQGSNETPHVGIAGSAKPAGGTFAAEPNSTSARGATGANEPLPYGGIISGAGAAPSGVGGRERRDRELVEWQMPIGVPAVIEPSPDMRVHHDPGPGVIGIDR
jgi:hypothetical protein